MKSKWIIPVFCVLMIFAYHFVAYTGHYGYDDLHYAKLANDLNHGLFDFTDHYSYRWPVVVLTALSYQLFGINDFASALPALLVLTTIILLVFQVLKRESVSVIVAGLSLVCLNPVMLLYSDKLMPDIYLALAVFAVLYTISQHRYGKMFRDPRMAAMVVAGALLVGFMTKTLIVLLFPFLLFLFISDIRKKQFMNFWKWGIGFTVAFFGIYFFVIFLLTGDPLMRFRTIADGTLQGPLAEMQTVGFFIRQVSYRFFALLTHEGIVPGFLLALPLLISKKWKDVFAMKDQCAFYMVASVFLLIAADIFVPGSFMDMYLSVSARHYLFLVPVMAIPAAYIVGEVFSGVRNPLPGIAVMFVCALIAVFLYGNSWATTYFPLLVILILAALSRNFKSTRRVFLVLLVLVLMIPPAIMVKRANEIHYAGQRTIVMEEFILPDSDCIVLTDDVQMRLAKYYQQFSACRTEFHHFREVVEMQGKAESVFILQNPYTLHLSGEKDIFQNFLKNKDMNRTFSDANTKMVVFQLK
ncbi:MAG: glycosyltransferase family 39 protein [Bacteroidetes bacterium]|nr:glycosyltransferase family 39 protein [Bacteroidota bacterium]MBU1720955.1 glycosyltransferase family 39 protein [Bacteroidota bacterium]